jgi:hypothetical protein
MITSPFPALASWAAKASGLLPVALVPSLPADTTMTIPACVARLTA